MNESDFKRPTLNIFPQGHYHYVHPDRLYSAGLRIVNILSTNGLIKPSEYSLLIYTPDRAKIEIATKRDLDLNSIKGILNRERDQCTIACWEETDSDSVENILDKCKATELRERILKGKHPSELSDEEWVDGINRIRDLRQRNEIRLSRSDDEYFKKFFLHFILNPVGYDRENKILSPIYETHSPQ